MKNPAGVKEFGIHLRRLREERNLSQQELADLADLAKKTVQRIENGKSAATNDVMFSLAKALSIEAKELLNFPIPKEKKS